MKFIKTNIKGVYVITLELRKDNRGSFTRNFCKKEFAEIGININIVQINRSLTKEKGTIRGLHYQRYPKSEDKIVQCLKGSIFDVAVDLRKNSPTYGKWVGETLSEDNNKMLLIPKGFAHGFQALDNNVVVQYFVSQYYSPDYEKGLRWNDPRLNIQWPIKDIELSDKDKQWPFMS